VFLFATLSGIYACTNDADCAYGEGCVSGTCVTYIEPALYSVSGTDYSIDLWAIYYNERTEQLGFEVRVDDYQADDIERVKVIFSDTSTHDSGTLPSGTNSYYTFLVDPLFSCPVLRVPEPVGIDKVEVTLVGASMESKTIDVYYECLQCGSNSHCQPTNEDVCEFGECICLLDSHCDDTVLSWCKDVGRYCVECPANSHCAGSAVCHSCTDTCEECENDGDCSGSEVCHSGTYTCEECENDGDCSGSDVCRTDNTCGACVSDSDCDVSGDVCHSGTNTCEECEFDSECTGSDVCRTDNTCGACVTDPDCDGSDVCHSVTNTCETCEHHSDCTFPRACSAAYQCCFLGSCY
jgi:hypothetical protein